MRAISDAMVWRGVSLSASIECCQITNCDEKECQGLFPVLALGSLH